MLTFTHFISNLSSNDNCSHFGPFAWPTHKGCRRHLGQRLVGQIPEDGSAADDAVSQCALCLRTLSGLGHRLCHQSTGTPVQDTSSARHQDTVETLLLCHKTSVRRQSQLPLHQHRQATGRPIIMEICTKNDLFGAIMSRGILETRLCASCN